MEASGEDATGGESAAASVASLVRAYVAARSFAPSDAESAREGDAVVGTAEAERLSQAIWSRFEYEIGPPYQPSAFGSGEWGSGWAPKSAVARSSPLNGAEAMPNPFATAPVPREACEAEEDEAAFASAWGALERGSGKQHAMSDDEVVVGRSSARGAAVILKDRRVSGKHFRIVYRGGDADPMLRDMSTNGTWLNGRRLKRGDDVPVFDGDVIATIDPGMADAEVGVFTLRLRDGAAIDDSGAGSGEEEEEVVVVAPVAPVADGAVDDGMDVTITLPRGGDFLQAVKEARAATASAPASAAARPPPPPGCAVAEEAAEAAEACECAAADVDADVDIDGALRSEAAAAQLRELAAAMRVLVAFAARELQVGAEGADSAQTAAVAVVEVAEAEAAPARSRAAAASAAWMVCALATAAEELERGALAAAAAALAGLYVHAVAHHAAEVAACERAGSAVRERFAAATEARALIGSARLVALLDAARC
jgi:hypothetical protein